MKVLKNNEENKEKLVDELESYWKEYLKIEKEFYKKAGELETRMRDEMGCPGLELAFPKYGGGLQLYFGIGFERIGKVGENEIGLIHASELERDSWEED